MPPLSPIMATLDDTVMENSKPDPKSIMTWTEDDLIAFLTNREELSIGLFKETDLKFLKTNNVGGRTFLRMTTDILIKAGLTLGSALAFEQIISELNAQLKPLSDHPKFPSQEVFDSSSITRLRTEMIGAHADSVAIALKIAPSNAAKAKNFRQIQEFDPVLNGHRVEQTDPPVALFNKAFGIFQQELDNPGITITDEQIESTKALLLSAPSLYATKAERAAALKESLKPLLGAFNAQVNLDKSQPDGVWSVQIPLGPIAAKAILEIKNEPGEGGSDSIIQGTFSHRIFFEQKTAAQIRHSCCCPSFVIAVSGPNITILGAIYIQNVVVQQLTDTIFLDCEPQDEARIDYIARLFRALKIGMDELDQFYRNLDLKPTDNRFFPYITEYQTNGQITRFTYISKRMKSHTKLVWVAATESGNIIVVKFVKRYNGVAQRLLADQQLAPKLFYDGTQDPDTPPLRGWYMVVMSFVQEVLWLPRAIHQICDSVRTAVKILHDNNLVFADLRAPNVMIQQVNGSVRGVLVDFDWCGEDGIGRYPVSLNTKLNWPPGVKSGAVLRKERDEQWLRRLPDDLLKYRRAHQYF